MKDLSRNHEEYLKRFLSEVDSRGYLKHRESTTMEFKKGFNIRNMPDYARTMAAFANNKGGYIIFGVNDSPRKLEGIRKERFEVLKQEKITEFLIEHFEPEIKWQIGVVEVEGKYFGYIYTYESENKPVICKKNADDKLKSGEIYYRYRAQTRRIEYPELRKIIDEYREKERQMWMKHIERIARVGPSNVALVDLLTGSVHVRNLKDRALVMDRKLLDELKSQVKFVEEGKFSEKEGEPTLKIVGEVQAVDMVVPDLDPNKDYPYIAKDLARELGITRYETSALIWRFGLKGDKRYHLEIKMGSSSRDKFSKYALERLREILNSQENKPLFLQTVRREYNRALNSKKKQ